MIRLNIVNLTARLTNLILLNKKEINAYKVISTEIDQPLGAKLVIQYGFTPCTKNTLEIIYPNQCLDPNPF